MALLFGFDENLKTSQRFHDRGIRARATATKSNRCHIGNAGVERTLLATTYLRLFGRDSMGLLFWQCRVFGVVVIVCRDEFFLHESNRSVFLESEPSRNREIIPRYVPKSSRVL